MCCFAAHGTSLAACICRYISREVRSSKGRTSTFFFSVHLVALQVFPLRIFLWSFLSDWAKMDQRGTWFTAPEKTLLCSPLHHYQFPVVPTQNLPSLTLACPWPHHPLTSFPPPRPASGSSLPSSFTVLQTTSPVTSFRQYFPLLCQLPTPSPACGLLLVVLRGSHPVQRCRVTQPCSLSTCKRGFASTIAAQIYWFLFLPDEQTCQTAMLFVLSL